MGVGDDANSLRASDASGGDSMAARLARQRQQRSFLRTQALPFDGAEASATSASVGSELHILRNEVASSGQVITHLQTQLKQSEEEIEQMGQNTARMAEELRLLKEQQAEAEAAAATDGPMSVAIRLDDGDDVTVSVSIACDNSGSPRAAINIAN